jgi:hypothetical protein
MSAHQMLNGTFDYNRTPLAPPGTKILIHEKPTQRTLMGSPRRRRVVLGTCNGSLLMLSRLRQQDMSRTHHRYRLIVPSGNRHALPNPN